MLGLTLFSAPQCTSVHPAEFQMFLSKEQRPPRSVCCGDGIPDHTHEGQLKDLGMLQPEEKQPSRKQSNVLKSPRGPVRGALQKVGLGFSANSRLFTSVPFLLLSLKAGFLCFSGPQGRWKNHPHSF